VFPRGPSEVPAEGFGGVPAGRKKDARKRTEGKEQAEKEIVL